ncbi:N-acetylmuramoyl-L-alanine amidase [Domibacillus sp. PGB-M46]|uniref:N-acetylmuramoyl-L-alanine amidase n=1 Tax=Domibacillus sp. PGB-M46 TaxID=2910255 RepID=UPI001F57233D|nr:N-acetylmuramoyl-L-alanine amidase [Domibacillus sp. PGB-M46]MCI2253861.1 N-acetylmuramoyl-L-alanine amidase [Domibacillus sp. PGB-M46]
MKKRFFFVVLAFILTVPLFDFGKNASAAGFVDVPYRASKEVNYLAEGGIANGSSATTFDSEKTVTRAEAAAFIGRALQLNGTKRETKFVDVGSGNFASGYIQSAVEKGILSGYDGGRFLPYKQVTRGEMAVMLSKAFGYSFGGTLSGAAQALMSRGIADGTADGSFGASYEIKRVDFAVFLARAIAPTFRTVQTDEFKTTMWTNTGDLNVRSGPSTAYASVGKLAKDARVSAAHSVGNWTYVRSGTIVGFVNSYYLRSTETTSATTADPRLAEQTIILDPGHGGSDPGAIGFGLHEADVVLTTGLKVNNLLKDTPFNVKMTRSTDTFITLANRAAFANKNNGDIFVSIHANAASPSASGTETFYSAASNSQNAADSKLLATKIQSRMIAAWNLNNRGVKTASYYVLKNNTVPAALLELGFITNKTDNDKLKSDYWLNVMSKAIYNGILDYYKAKGYNVTSLYK